MNDLNPVRPAFSGLRTLNGRIPAATPSLYNRVLSNPVNKLPLAVVETPQPQFKQTSRYISAGVGKDAAQPVNTGDLTLFPLNDRYPDAEQILFTLNGLGEQYGRDPNIRQAAVEVLGPSLRNNEVGVQIQRVANWVRYNVIYLADPDGAEYVQSPLRMLTTIAGGVRAYGDCDDHVLLLNSLLNAVGVRAIPVAVKLYSQERFDHVVTGVWIKGGWRLIDPCAKAFSAEPYYSEVMLPF